MKKLIIFAICLISTMTLFLVGCGGGSTGKVADNTEHITTITKQCKLTKSYEGKDFFKEGIGAATIAHYTDGDTLTVSFLVGEATVPIRFHSIDTPESTGGVEKWGKAASLFVERQLAKATDIVVEATAIPAEKDSYNSRYLGYIWYRQSSNDDFVNLNLELVENGFSENKGVDTTKFPYNSYFKQAENNARVIKLRIFSDLPDPLFSEDPIETSIKDILLNLDTYYNDENNSGAKVRLFACLTQLDKSKGSSPTFTFTAEEYDQEEQKFYSIYVYAGYSSSPASKLKLGHLYRIVGTLQKFNGKLQISGIDYSPVYGATNIKYTYPIQRDYYLNFNSDQVYNSYYGDVLYTNATVVSSSVKDGVLSIQATASKRTMKDVDGEMEEVLEQSQNFEFTVNVSEDYTNQFSVGTVFSVKGYQFEADSGVIFVPNYRDITKK